MNSNNPITNSNASRVTAEARSLGLASPSFTGDLAKSVATREASALLHPVPASLSSDSDSFPHVKLDAVEIDGARRRSQRLRRLYSPSVRKSGVRKSPSIRRTPTTPKRRREQVSDLLTTPRSSAKKKRAHRLQFSQEKPAGTRSLDEIVSTARRLKQEVLTLSESFRSSDKKRECPQGPLAGSSSFEETVVSSDCLNLPTMPAMLSGGWSDSTDIAVDVTAEQQSRGVVEKQREATLAEAAHTNSDEIEAEPNLGNRLCVPSASLARKAAGRKRRRKAKRHSTVDHTLTLLIRRGNTLKDEEDIRARFLSELGPVLPNLWKTVVTKDGNIRVYSESADDLIRVRTVVTESKGLFFCEERQPRRRFRLEGLYVLDSSKGDLVVRDILSRNPCLAGQLSMTAEQLLDASTGSAALRVVTVLKKRGSLADWVFEASNGVFQAFIEAKSLYLSGCKVKVREHVYVVQCGNCCALGHTSSTCKGQARCKRCGTSGHDASRCTATGVTCGNCPLSTRDGHKSFADACPTRKKFLNKHLNG